MTLERIIKKPLTAFCIMLLLILSPTLTFVDAGFLVAAIVILSFCLLNYILKCRHHHREEVYWKNECDKMWKKYGCPYGYNMSARWKDEDLKLLDDLINNKYI